MGFLFAKKAQINTSQVAVGAVAVQSSSQGVPIPIVYGTTRITGNTIWYGDFTAIPHTTTQTSGGKGGGGGVTTSNTDYTYTVAIAIGLCEGPILGVGKIWEQKTITTEAGLGLTGFLGSYAQTPWGYLTTNHPGQDLAYRGLAYEANAAFDLGTSASLPNLSFEINGTGSILPTTTTWDPAAKSARITLSGGNLTETGDGTANFQMVKATTYKSTGKWYAELPVGNGNINNIFGIVDAAASVNSYVGVDAHGYGWGLDNPGGLYHVGGTGVLYGFWPGIISILLDLDAHTLSFWVAGVDKGIAFSGIGAGPWAIAISNFSAGHATINFGGSAFTYTPPAGYLPWTIASTVTDVNPKDVATDLLSNVNYGANFPSSQVGDLSAFYNFCYYSGILVAPAYTAQQAAKDTLTELFLIGNSAPFWSEGLLKATPYADANVGSFVPNTTINYDLTDDDFLAPPGEPPITVKRRRPADAFNQVQVQCKDRSNNYNNYVAEATDQSAIDLYGLRALPLITIDAICLPAVARLVAQAQLARVLYYLNTYEFTLGWKHARLEPMDLISLTDAGLGLSLSPARVLTVDEDAEGNLKITAEDFKVGVANPGSYTTQTSGGYTINVGVSPGNANTPVVFQPPVALAGAPEIWLGTSGGANWGGAEIWGSTDNVTYAKVGAVTTPARHGTLTANLPIGSGAGVVTLTSPSTTIAWTPQTLPAAPSGSTVADANSIWVLTSANGGYFFDPAGAYCTAFTLPDSVPITDRTWPPVWNGSSWLTVSAGNGSTSTDKCSTSADGITWTQQTMASSGFWHGVAWNGSTYCALKWLDSAGAATDVVATSPTGATGTWAEHNIGVAAQYYSIVWNGSVFCAVSRASTAESATSSDGVTWTAHAMPGVADGLSWSGTTFCAVLYGSANAFTSTDGLNWTLRTLPRSAGWLAPAWNGFEFLTVSGFPAAASVSPDGATWTTQTVPATSGLWQLPLVRSGLFYLLSESFSGSTASLLYVYKSASGSGTTTVNLSANNVDTVSTLSVDLTVSQGALASVTTAEAQALTTLSYVDGELLGYQNASLTSAYHYDLTTLYRGTYTAVASHLTGSKFMRLDGAVGKVGIDETYVGRTLYIKLLSFNKLGLALQGLADVAAITYTVLPIDYTAITPPGSAAAPMTIAVNNVLYIPAGVTWTVATRMTNYGRIQDLGSLVIT